MTKSHDGGAASNAIKCWTKTIHFDKSREWQWQQWSAMTMMVNNDNDGQQQQWSAMTMMVSHDNMMSRFKANPSRGACRISTTRTTSRLLSSIIWTQSAFLTQFNKSRVWKKNSFFLQIYLRTQNRYNYTCVCVCECVYVCVCVCVCVFVCLWLCVLVFMYMFESLYLHEIIIPISLQLRVPVSEAP